ncbi:MAG: hypothetical protein M0Z33_02090 [Actinomycetota bacterium]|nr:hypothetical protein [Actinomycetota bacterium]
MSGLVLTVWSVDPGWALDEIDGRCLTCGHDVAHHVRFGIVVVPRLDELVDEGWRCGDCCCQCQYDEIVPA